MCLGGRDRNRRRKRSSEEYDDDGVRNLFRGFRMGGIYSALQILVGLRYVQSNRHYFVFESAPSIVYWNEKKRQFVQIAISD